VVIYEIVGEVPDGPRVVWMVRDRPRSGIAPVEELREVRKRVIGLPRQVPIDDVGADDLVPG
jgi:hypothetical protein